MKLIKICKLSENGKIPIRVSPGSAGFDLFSSEQTFIPPSKVHKSKFVEVGRGLVKTDLVIEIPNNCVGKICSRSGLSVTKNIEIGAGWIDSDYRGELMIEVKNFSSELFPVEVGFRIAQIIIFPIVTFSFKVVNQLSETIRGEKGFGSSGV